MALYKIVWKLSAKKELKKIDKNSKILILGTFPSIKSFEDNFWKYPQLIGKKD